MVGTRYALCPPYIQCGDPVIKSLFTREPRPILRLVFFAALAITLIIVDRRTSLLVKARAALSLPLSSIQYIVSWPARIVDDWGAAISTHKHLFRENQALLAEQLLLKAKVQRLAAVESENRQLLELLHTSTQVQGRVLVARLLAVDSDPFVHQVVLDRGQHDGVFVGQPVLDAAGVMGQVIQVNPFTSQVLLITDPRSGVPVEDVRSGVRAIAAGDMHTGGVHLVNVPQTIDVRAGDLLITSGIGTNYPRGYPVGQVSSVSSQPGQQFYIIPVTVAAQPDRSRQALLVWPDRIAHS